MNERNDRTHYIIRTDAPPPALPACHTAGNETLPATIHTAALTQLSALTKGQAPLIIEIRKTDITETCEGTVIRITGVEHNATHNPETCKGYGCKMRRRWHGTRRIRAKVILSLAALIPWFQIW